METNNGPSITSSEQPNITISLISEEKQIQEVLLAQNKRDAEIKELIKWKSREVYTEINDKGQNCTCPRQFIKFTIMNDKPGINAHLCARSFEEGKNLRTESPTCLRKWVTQCLTQLHQKNC